MTMRMLYLKSVRLAGRMALLARSSASEGAEVLVLRQEAAPHVRRQNPRPKMDWPDRAMLPLWPGCSGRYGRADWSRQGSRQASGWPERGVAGPCRGQGGGRPDLAFACGQCNPRVPRWAVVLKGDAHHW
jgi:hypothetical protein